MHADVQLGEVVRAMQLEGLLRPFTRCRECNTILDDVGRGDVLERLPERIGHLYERFKRCAGCGRVYWEGSHYDRMKRLVDRLA